VNSKYNSSHFESRENIICPEEQVAWLKGLVNFTDSETYLLAKFADSLKKSLMPKDLYRIIQHVQNAIFIRKWFLKCCLSNAEDGLQDDILWDNKKQAMKMLELQKE